MNSRKALNVILELWAITCLSVSRLSAQEDKLPMTISFSAFNDSMKIHPKPVLLLIYTDWCSYCSMQKQQLIKNKHFTGTDQPFYLLELNAESKDTILFHGHHYTYQGNGPSSGVHELAMALQGNGGEAGYPAWVLLDTSYRVIYRHNGLLKPAEVQSLLDAIGTMKHVKEKG